MPYTELHCTTNFTFLHSASHPEELVSRAHELGYSALAITDECSVSGVVRAYERARELDFRIIVGSEFRLEDGPRLLLLATNRAGYGQLCRLITVGRRRSVKGEYRLFTDDLAQLDHLPDCLAVLLPSVDGRVSDEHLAWFMASFRSLDGAEGGIRGDALAMRESPDSAALHPGYGPVEASHARDSDRNREHGSLLHPQPEHPEGAVLPCRSGLCPRSQSESRAEPAPTGVGDSTRRGWLAVGQWRDGLDRERLQRLTEQGGMHGLPLVAVGGVRMHRRGRRALHDLLTAIRLNQPVTELGRELLANGEHHLRSLDDLASLYPSALLAETQRIAGRCDFSLNEIRYQYPDDVTPSDTTPHAFLRQLTEQGIKTRWPDGLPDKVRTQIEHELTLIAELEYEAYFLTVWDIVHFARSRDILCQGRGSAANSAVCYCLEITEVDPSRMNLLFERFISRERGEPPDIDVDFEHERREEVIQYIYQKYGRERAALAATLITYRPKSALRDTGKALGLDLGQIEQLVASVSGWRPKKGSVPFSTSSTRTSTELPEKGTDPFLGFLREAGFDPDNPLLQRVLRLSNDLLGFPRHLSQHVGGFVIARESLPELVPIENAAMPERTVIQWDKNDLQTLGLLKVDVLALGMLSAIRRSLALINDWNCRSGLCPRTDSPSRAEPAPTGNPTNDHQGTTPVGASQARDSNNTREHGSLLHSDVELTMAAIPPEDPAVYEMIQRADTIGVFQIESRAQMSMLPRLRPERFSDLVIEVAIVRPGPIQGDMVHPYLRRRQGQEPITYPSEAVREVLERTLGVPLFQEQVIKLAMVAAGFTPGEADNLRRAMAAWKRRGGIEPYRDKLLQGMAGRGYAPEFAERIFRQILGFGEYGFPESHAASFALLAYVSAWLKRHYPAAFCAALINSLPMGFYQPAQLVRDAREHGVEIRPADVRYSDWECTLEEEKWGQTSFSAKVSESPTETEAKIDLSPFSEPVLRLGLCLVDGLSKQGAQRLVAARQQQAFLDVQDLALRADLNQADLKALAAADALSGLAGHRYQARWAVAGAERQGPLLQGAGFEERQPELFAPDESADVLADYASTGLTLRSHPLALLREQLSEMGYLSSEQVALRPPDSWVRLAGLVLIRQRPGNGKAIFVTLEDEHGSVNLIVWASLAERQRKELLGAKLLGVVAQVQRAEGVQHLVCRKLEDRSELLGQLQSRSRDFH